MSDFIWAYWHTQVCSGERLCVRLSERKVSSRFVGFRGAVQHRVHPQKRRCASVRVWGCGRVVCVVSGISRAKGRRSIHTSWMIQLLRRCVFVSHTYGNHTVVSAGSAFLYSGVLICSAKRFYNKKYQRFKYKRTLASRGYPIESCVTEKFITS